MPRGIRTVSRLLITAIAFSSRSMWDRSTYTLETRSSSRCRSCGCAFHQIAATSVTFEWGEGEKSAAVRLGRTDATQQMLGELLRVDDL